MYLEENQEISSNSRDNYFELLLHKNSFQSIKPYVLLNMQNSLGHYSLYISMHININTIPMFKQNTIIHLRVYTKYIC